MKFAVDELLEASDIVLGGRIVLEELLLETDCAEGQADHLLDAAAV